MGGVEALGLLKMDFLGLRNLSVIELTLDNIRANRGEEARCRSPRSRGPARSTICSAGARRRACSSSSRPGCGGSSCSSSPTASGDHGVDRALPAGPDGADPASTSTQARQLQDQLSPLLARARSPAETYGVLVYQEQIVQLLQILAGYSLGKPTRYGTRSARRTANAWPRRRPRFVEGCTGSGMKEAEAAASCGT